MKNNSLSAFFTPSAPVAALRTASPMGFRVSPAATEAARMRMRCCASACCCCS